MSVPVFALLEVEHRNIDGGPADYHNEATRWVPDRPGDSPHGSARRAYSIPRSSAGTSRGTAAFAVAGELTSMTREDTDGNPAVHSA